MTYLLEEMFKEQYELNDKLLPNWKESLTIKDWYAEIMAELMEAMESINHKWWAKGKEDKINFLIEIIDAWHFFLSSLAYHPEITRNVIFDRINLFFNNPLQLEKDSFEANVRYLVVDVFLHSSLAEMINYEALVKLTKLAGVDNIIDLYSLYLVKKTLNSFRKDNGYKEGRYQKMWGDEEDNHFIFKWYLDNKDDLVSSSTVEFTQLVKAQLSDRYKVITTIDKVCKK